MWELIKTLASRFHLGGARLELAQCRAALHEKNELISLLLRDFDASACDWLWETDAALHVQRVSPRLAQVAGREAHAIAGRFPEALESDALRFEHFPGSPLDQLGRLLSAQNAFRDMVIPVRVKNEEHFWSLSAKPVFDQTGAFAGYRGVGSDISGERRQQEQIAYLALHDALTSLPNRALFNDTIATYCANGTKFALLYLDLDFFKAVNDTDGHSAGDIVLVGAAERISASLPAEDFLAHLAGDEFAIITLNKNINRLENLASTLVAQISQPFPFGDKVLQVGLSAGIVLSPRDGTDPAALVMHGNLAAQRAKAEGRGTWRFYNPEMDERLNAKRTMRADLQMALAREEFRLDYQPVMNLARNHIVGAEALLRWHHPVKGLMPPLDFIPLAEETGLIAPIGEWVLREACKTAATWPGHVGIAVNLSPVQFREPGLVAAITSALADAGLAPGRLELEITESTLLETSTGAVEVLTHLSKLGVRIALDDFGTGYSSLSYLRRFPFNKIKIDRSFVQDLCAHSGDSSIVRAIIELAERLSMNVTAEGVETQAQAELLNGFGCELGQGYLFSRPVPASKIATLLAAEARAPEVEVMAD